MIDECFDGEPFEGESLVGDQLLVEGAAFVIDDETRESEIRDFCQIVSIKQKHVSSCHIPVDDVAAGDKLEAIGNLPKNFYDIFKTQPLGFGFSQISQQIRVCYFGHNRWGQIDESPAVELDNIGMGS